MKSIVLDIASSLRGRRSKGREKGFRGRQAISPEKGTAKETPRGRVFPMELEKMGGNWASLGPKIWHARTTKIPRRRMTTVICTWRMSSTDNIFTSSIGINCNQNTLRIHQPIAIRILTCLETLAIEHYKSAKLIAVRNDKAVDICFDSNGRETVVMATTVAL